MLRLVKSCLVNQRVNVISARMVSQRPTFRFVFVTFVNVFDLILLVQLSAQPIKVQVSQGVVVGQQKTLPNGNIYHSFQGIPYAVPPLGNLRFKVMD